MRERHEPIRDATAVELQGEPDVVLQNMVEGTIKCTETSKQLAKAELDYRRLRRKDKE